MIEKIIVVAPIKGKIDQHRVLAVALNVAGSLESFSSFEAVLALSEVSQPNLPGCRSREAPWIFICGAQTQTGAVRHFNVVNGDRHSGPCPGKPESHETEGGRRPDRSSS